MTKRQAIEALDNSLRDIMNCPNMPFGGKTVVFGGISGKSYQLCGKGPGLR